MGTRPYVSTNLSQMARPKAARTRSLHRISFDLPLVLVVICLIVFGLLMLYSASSDIAFQWKDDPAYFINRQLLWVGLGILSAIIFAWLDYRWWRRLALPAMLGTIALLVIVLIIGYINLGAIRTLFNASGQPSEVAKLVVIIYLSVWLFNKRDQLHTFSLGLLPVSTILGIVGGLIALQPDVSALITIFGLGLIMFILAGGSLRQMFVVMGFGSLVGWVVYRSGVFATGTERINSFLEGMKDPTKYSDHVQRAFEAFIQGGWLGNGLGNSRTKLLSLPLPHTDSIFAVVGEEFGVLGAALVVILFLVLLWRGLVIAGRAPDGLGSLLAGGLTFWIILEAFINMAVLMGLMPFAGNALPFFSAGGSNLIVTLVAVGILMNISRTSSHHEEKEGSAFSAIVDLRRWNGRRRVSRARRTAGSVEQS